MPTWTPQQLQCLDALNIPVMAFVKPEVNRVSGAQQAAKPHAETAVSTTPLHESITTMQATALKPATKAPQSAAPNESYFYRLGPWLFQSSTQLPVTGISWINDLAAYADTRLSQISHVADAFNIDSYLQNSLTPEQKRELWEALKARLKHRKDTTDAEQATQDKPKPQ